MNARTIVATMATSVTTTSAIPVGEWRAISIEAPTFAASFLGATVAVNVKVSNELAGTYRPLQNMLTSGSTFLAVAVAVPGSVGNFNIIARDAQNFNYMKLDTDTATTNTYEFKVNVSL